MATESSWDSPDLAEIVARVTETIDLTSHGMVSSAGHLLGYVKECKRDPGGPVPTDIALVLGRMSLTAKALRGLADELRAEAVGEAPTATAPEAALWAAAVAGLEAAEAAFRAVGERCREQQERRSASP
ncbi:hypothetical protein ACSDR0_47905 [Streptosporangium sp. G11]|uniref:hypothetical protein n=1 Tax=Streptosporangium sp. G11 TaxID=3436926 RepID=UPI003EB7BB0D